MKTIQSKHFFRAFRHSSGNKVSFEDNANLTQGIKRVRCGPTVQLIDGILILKSEYIDSAEEGRFMRSKKMEINHDLCNFRQAWINISL